MAKKRARSPVPSKEDTSSLGPSKRAHLEPDGMHRTPQPLRISERTKDVLGQHCSLLSQEKCDMIGGFLSLLDGSEEEKKRIQERVQATGKTEEKLKIHEDIDKEQNKKVTVYIKLNYAELTWEKTQKRKAL